ncbi:MAG: glycosyl hydrolase family 28 protein [Myxococcota bacterium]|nr:glycosyl hydrolase family 28 protein [Myxococcota bacterium]
MGSGLRRAVLCAVALVGLVTSACGSSGSTPPSNAATPQQDGASPPVGVDASVASDAATGALADAATTTPGPVSQDAAVVGADESAVTLPVGDAAPASDAAVHPTDAGPVAPAGDGGVGWDTVPAILARIVPPTFPNVDCVLTDMKYGGVGDGTTDNTAAFASAIQDCSSRGGGRVVVPAGTFFTGPIVLLSKINLFLAGPTSVIKFTTDPMKYLPVVEVSFEGTLIMNYHPLISANGATDIAITGTGTLEGNATASDWYAPMWTAMSFDQAPRIDNQMHKLPVSSRVYGDGHFLRPSLIEFMHCHNILLDGFTAQHSPFWTIHPVMSDNITGTNLKIIGTVGNTDGFDPESCVDVLLKNLTIQVGDDSIAIKAGRDLDGRTLYTPSKNIVIQNCQLSTGNPGHGGAVAIGSEMSAGVSNVYEENVTYTTGVNGGLQSQAIYLKGSIYRGGYIHDFYARNLTVDQISTFIWVNGQYGDTAPAGRPTAFIDINNINVDGATVNAVTGGAFWLTGADATRPETNIHFSNIKVVSGAALGAGRVAHYSGLTTTNVTVAGAPFTPPATAP